MKYRGIYIKPENRGKFTATKKRTGKTTEELTHSKNPLTRKRAIFAQNAKKWKKEDGGKISEMGYRDDSPYRGRKQITIDTPTGLIDMSKTGTPIMANGVLLQPYSGMHQFDTTKVVEKRMQEGGMTREDMYNYLFDEQQGPQLPSENDLEPEVIQENIKKSIFEQEQYEASMAIISQPFLRGNNVGLYSGRINSQPLKLGSKFQSFSTPEEGMSALKNQLELYKTGKTRNPVKPTSTLYEAMSVYAPSSDNNNPKKYAEFIAGKLGIPATTPISQIPTDKWAEAIKIMEGNKVGNNPGNLKRIN